MLLENDANCAAWGEYCAMEQKANMLMLTLGTGIGSGIVIDGELYRGSRGYAGELGHVIIHPGGEQCACGQKGCFERYASVSALVKRAGMAAEQNKDSILAKAFEKSANGKSFFDAAAQNCPIAQKVLTEYTDELKVGIDSICSIFDPQCIVIGGGISEQKEMFFDRLCAVCSGVELRQAVLGNDAGVIGAANLAMRRQDNE